MDSPRQRQGVSEPAAPFRARVTLPIFGQWNAALRAWIIPFLVKNRRRVMIGVLAGVLIMELGEHITASSFGERSHQIFDAVIFVLLVPAVMWLMLSLLETTDNQRRQANEVNDQRAQFSQRLGSATSWEELVRQVIEYAHLLLPQAHITLSTYQSDPSTILPEAVCDPNGTITLSPALQPVINGPASSPPADFTPGEFAFPISRSGQPIGLLAIKLPPDCPPAPEALQALRVEIPVIALAMEGALLQALALEQAAASENQRQQIAQNLHDTLAQNISYLRLKLDQLTGENAIREIGVVLQELERMRTTADEAYEQVRTTLDELNPIRAEDLVMMILKQARVISQRAQFTLRTTQIGSPFTLPPATRQQILFILREALHNIEKHARATQVHLQFLWLDNELILKVSDNGVGFDQSTSQSDGHYGLWIMQHRAQEIGGVLKINPVEADEEGSPGTEVTLWVPRPAYPASKSPLIEDQHSSTE